jgi:hypothetical protein
MRTISYRWWGRLWPAAAAPAQHVVQGTLAADGSVTVMCSGADVQVSCVAASSLSPWLLSHALATRYLADNAGGVLGNESLAQNEGMHLTGIQVLGPAPGHSRHLAPQVPRSVLRME